MRPVDADRDRGSDHGFTRLVIVVIVIILVRARARAGPDHNDERLGVLPVDDGKTTVRVAGGGLGTAMEQLFHSTAGRMMWFQTMPVRAGSRRRALFAVLVDTWRARSRTSPLG